MAYLKIKNPKTGELLYEANEETGEERLTEAGKKILRQLSEGAPPKAEEAKEAQ